MAVQKFRTITGLETQEIDMISPDKSDIITVSMSDTDSVIFSGDTGQLMSVTDATSGIICSVNDISGIPSFEVHDDGTVIIAEGIGNVLIGTNVDSGEKFQVSGSIGASSMITDYMGSYDVFATNVYASELLSAGEIHAQGPIYASTYGIVFPGTAGSITSVAGEMVIKSNFVYAKINVHAPLYVTDRITATNFEGSSTGTNTGDETLLRINALLPDNGKLLFGTGNDASIYYNGTKLIINPKEVGSGSMNVSGDINASTITGTTINVNTINVTPKTRLTTTSGTLATNAKTAFHDILNSDGGDLTIVGFDNLTGYTQTSKISYSVAGNGNVAYDEYSRIYTYMGALGNFSVEYISGGNSKLYITQFSTNSTNWVVYDTSLTAEN